MTDDHSWLEEQAIKVNAFRNLDKPTILASGLLGWYFVNGENFLEDGGAWQAHKGYSNTMIAHAIDVMEHNPDYRRVIDILAAQAKELLANADNPAISGGENRDWLYSGPVAHVLGVPHVSLYKDGQSFLHEPDGELSTIHLPLMTDTVHIVDMITKGSSIYRNEDGKEQGWIPQLRHLGVASIDHVIALITRNQGGELMLAEQGVTAHTHVSIDEDFLRRHSKRPHEDIAYFHDDRGYCERYLAEHGALELVDFFDPAHPKPDKREAFLRQFGDHLRTVGRYDELADAIKTRYGVNME